MTSDYPWGLHGVRLGAIGNSDPQHIPVTIRVDHVLLVEALGTVVLHFQMLDDATAADYVDDG